MMTPEPPFKNKSTPTPIQQRRYKVLLTLSLTMIPMLLYFNSNCCFLNDNQNGQVREKHKSSSTRNTHNTSLPKLSDVQVLAPAYPGNSQNRGFTEFSEKLIRSIQFFWPLDELDLVVVLDENVYATANERDDMTNTVKSLFTKKVDIKNLTVAYNPLYDQSLYGPGHDIQQLIMFWADNFTDAPYIGFVDDDTVFTHSVQQYDLFDGKGRPRVLTKYFVGEKLQWAHKWYRFAYEALGGQQIYLNAMSYFPVVIKREHLGEIRDAITTAQNCSYFDEAMSKLIHQLPGHSLSQFIIMFNYLWDHHRDEYRWYFEPFSHKPFFPHGMPSNSNAAKEYYYMKSGSPTDNGVTPDMRRPFPRIAVHVRCDMHGQCAPKEYQKQVWGLMKQGYCFSLSVAKGSTQGNYSNMVTSKQEWRDEENQVGEPRCNGFNLTHDVGNFFQFEKALNAWRVVDPEGTRKACQARTALNEPHKWDLDMVERIFREAP